MTLWFTGLSGAGKSTLARQVEKRLFGRHYLVAILDGDNLRHGLCKDLGFEANHRSENIRRCAEVAKLLNDAGFLVICAFISPKITDRETARNIIGKNRFHEIFIDSPLSVCERRDPKGMYRLARAGKINNLTGVTAPYEVPQNPDLCITTNDQSLQKCTDQLVSYVSWQIRVMNSASNSRSKRETIERNNFII